MGKKGDHVHPVPPWHCHSQAHCRKLAAETGHPSPAHARPFPPLAHHSPPQAEQEQPDLLSPVPSVSPLGCAGQGWWLAGELCRPLLSTGILSVRRPRAHTQEPAKSTEQPQENTRRTHHTVWTQKSSTAWEERVKCQAWTHTMIPMAP